jgi:hypothetical protein
MVTVAAGPPLATRDQVFAACLANESCNERCFAAESKTSIV